MYTDASMSSEKRPRPGGVAPAGKTKLPGYSARPSGPAWERRGHGNRRSSGRRHGVRRTRRVALIVGAVVLVAVLGGLIAFLANRDDEPDLLGSTTTLDPSTLSPEGQELYALVQSSQAGTYHVAFAVESPELASSGAAAAIEIWRKGDQFREHRVGVDASGTSNTVVIGGPDGAVSCGGDPAAPPTCADAAGSEPTLDGAFATIIADVANGETTVADETVAELRARCFTVVSGEQTIEVCFTAEGIPLRVDDGVIHFEASVVETTVPDDVLVLPAVGAEPPPAVTIPPPVAPTTTAPPATTAPAGTTATTAPGS